MPENRIWAGKLITYWKEFGKQRKATDEETRMIKRFGNEYTFSVLIADKMKKSGRRQTLLLMPPTSYFMKAGVNYHVPEPAVFYYFTGIKTVWANSPEALGAEWYVRVDQGKIVLSSASNKMIIQDTIAAFRKLGVSL